MAVPPHSRKAIGRACGRLRRSICDRSLPCRTRWARGHRLRSTRGRANISDKQGDQCGCARCRPRDVSRFLRVMSLDSIDQYLRLAYILMQPRSRRGVLENASLPFKAATFAASVAFRLRLISLAWIDRPRPPDLLCAVPGFPVLPAVSAAGTRFPQLTVATHVTMPIPSPGAARCFELVTRTASEHAKSVRDFFRDFVPPISDFRRFLFGFRACGGRSPARKTRCRSMCLSIETRPTLRARQSSGSSDAPALQARSPARSSPPPQACGMSRRGGRP